MAGAANRADLYSQDGEAVPEKEAECTQYDGVGDILVYHHLIGDYPQ